MSADRVIVQWVSETGFSAVRKSRTFPVGRTETDKEMAARNSDVTQRYLAALELLS